MTDNHWLIDFSTNSPSKCVKDTHRENAPSNKTPTFTKSTNIGIWVVGTSNQLFSQKNKVVTGKIPFFVICPFCIHHSICLSNGFWYGSFDWKWCFFNFSAFNWKTILQFFEKDFRLTENLFQSWNIENVQNFYLLLHKNMPISQTEGDFEIP